MHLVTVLVQIKLSTPTHTNSHHKMQLKTILNSVTNYKSFIFGKCQIVETDQAKVIEVEVRPRSNGLRICSGCCKVTPGYDTMSTPRRFDFVPMWGMAVVFIYFMRRVNSGQR